MITAFGNVEMAVWALKEGATDFVLRPWQNEKMVATLTRAAAEKIFIPFFTTKRTGSGIGLSISKQIMRLHNGTISVHSPAQGGCVFRLQF